MTAKRVAEASGTDSLALLFADTKMEDADTYRFVDEAAANVGGRLVKIADGRDVWQIFHDKRYLGNTRVDPCSRILKRELMRDWLEANCDPERATIYLGFDWTEPHRIEGARNRWAPWKVEFPMTQPPYIDKDEMRRLAEAEGLQPSELYRLRFPHSNCGGFCVKAGQAQFDLLLRAYPERYRYHEQKEQELREHLGKDVAILRDRRGGETKPLTLRAFRERMEAGESHQLDWGDCHCVA